MSYLRLIFCFFSIYFVLNLKIKKRKRERTKKKQQNYVVKKPNGYVRI